MIWFLSSSGVEYRNHTSKHRQLMYIQSCLCYFLQSNYLERVAADIDAQMSDTATNECVPTSSIVRLKLHTLQHLTSLLSCPIN